MKRLHSSRAVLTTHPASNHGFQIVMLVGAALLLPTLFQS